MAADTSRARAAAQAALAGRTPLEAGMQKSLAALVWVYRWGYSSPSIMDTVAGIEGAPRRGVAARLAKRGLLARHSVPVVAPHLPRAIMTLTAQGVSAVEAAGGWWPDWAPPIDELSPYEDGIIERQIVHDLAVQKITLEFLCNGKISGFKTPREMKSASEKGKKQPDAVWIMDGKHVALELELTRKKPGKEWDDTRLATLQALQDGVYDMVIYVTHSPAILRHIQDGYAPGATLTRWGYDASRHLVPVKRGTVPEALAARVQAVLREDLL